MISQTSKEGFCTDILTSGERKIKFAQDNMPVVDLIGMRWSYSLPFAGKRIAVYTHITKETAAAVIALQTAGAEIVLAGSNPMSIQDDVAEALREKYGMTVLGYRGETDEEWLQFRRQALDMHPDLILEDSAKLLQLLYEEKPECVEHLIGNVEQTTAGSKRISLMDSVGILKKPVIAASNSVIKYWFDNKYGVGQTALGTLLHLTGDLVAGITVVIVGYGSVGHGCAARCAGAGAHVIVSESDPVRALQAYYDGYFVMDIDRAAKLGDVFITATGSSNVIPFECVRNMKSGARLINLGSGQSEIPVSEIKENAIRLEKVSDSEIKYYFSKEKFVQLVADGRTANLVVVGGNPPSIMDLTFASMLLSLEYLLKNDGKLEAHLLSAPYETDRDIALLKLNELGVDINKKTTAQIKYDSDWRTK